MNYLQKAYQLFRQGGAREIWQRLQAKRHFWRHRRQYQAFLRAHRPTAAELETQRKVKFKFRPCFGVTIPLYNTKLEYLQELLASFQAQAYGDFKLFCVDASPAKKGKTALTDFMQAAAQQDARIIYQVLGKNAGIAANTNQAIALAMRDADVTHIALCDHDDFVEPNALFEYAKVLNENQNAKIIYSDEDVLRCKDDPNAAYIMKPDWNPFLLESCNYINHFFVCEKALLKQIKTKNGLYERPDFDGAQDYDLYLRLTEKAQALDAKLQKQEAAKIKTATYTSSTIFHVPKVLYHWRAAENSTAQDPYNKLYAFDAGKRALDEHFQRCGIDAVAEHTEVWGTYRTKYKLKDTDEDFLLFSLDGAKALESDSVAEMAAILQRNQVGVVGAQILAKNGTIQSAGVIVGAGNGGMNAFRGLRPKFTYANRAQCVTNYSAVSGACLMVRRSVYDQVGGFDKNIAFGDVDFCLKVRALGKQVVYTPHAKFQSTLNPANPGTPLQKKWPAIFAQGDPYYNPNFALDHSDYSLRVL